ncbi:uncharacterized protein J3D65DRAFT_402307 [Phyllosticta citribraziliensis]|uniref:F-box domain-containing protein n=1 Tax=Phyllosticta citribraziliensis TaxID=989973 RepID=A0ABR1LLI0_9PEZI
MAPSTPSSLALSPSGSCWSSVPPEIVLEIVSCLDYDPETLRNLRRVDKRTYRIMRDYEHSVCKSFATGQLRLGILRSPDLLSPSSGGVAADISYRALAAVFHRTAAVTELARTIKTSSPCCWLLTWRHIFEAGIRLLFRLHASRTYNSKANFIYDMPLHALVAVFVVLHYGCRAAQNVGIGIIRRENQPADDRDLGDLLLMFQDLCLQCGPDFLSKILNHDKDAEAKLRSGWKALDSLQSPDANGNPPRPSLISHFNRAISFALECRLGEIHCMAMDVATRKAMRKMTDADVTNLACFNSTSG